MHLTLTAFTALLGVLMLNTIKRAGKVLTLFKQGTSEWGVREAALELGWPRSTTHQILTSLASIGLLQQNSKGKYRLGWRILTLSKTLLKSSRLEMQANALVHRLATTLNQTVTIATWDGHRVVCLSSFDGQKGTPALSRGTRLPGHASALGKVLMSNLNETEVDFCIERFGLPRLTDRTNIDKQKFLEQLVVVRQTGIAFDSGEAQSDRYCIAAPIRDANSDSVVAISVSADKESMRLHQQTYINALKGAANRVTQSLFTDPLDDIASALA